jgi:hypothetical protein
MSHRACVELTITNGTSHMRASAPVTRSTVRPSTRGMRKSSRTTFGSGAGSSRSSLLSPIR